MSKNELKRQVLKSRISNPEEEIKYVSRILRKKFRKKKVSENYDHQSGYYKNFWKYFEKVLEPKEKRVKPLFTGNDCESILRIFSPKKIVKNASHLNLRLKRLKIQSLTSTLNHQLTLK